MTLEKIKNILENLDRIIIVTKNPISTILKCSINQGQNNNLNKLGTGATVYALDLNIDFTNLINYQEFKQDTLNQFIYFVLLNCKNVNIHY